MPTTPRSFVPSAFFALACFLFAAVPGWGLPMITAVPKGLVAQGITPGGRAIWWSVAHEHPDAFETIVHRLEEQIDDDRDGSVVLDPKGPVALTSLWVVVDVATGTYATYAPEDFGVSEIPLPAEAAVQSSGRSPADEFREVARPLVEVLLIRAGQGAWILRAGDGGETDLDTVEGELSFAIDAMAAVGESPAVPGRYEMGDRLLSIDVEQLELSSLVVGPPPPAAAGTRTEVVR